MITPPEISQYLQTQSDFDLELFVYRSLRLNGIEAQHGGNYIDPITGKARQFDIRAYALVHATCAVRLAIECKSLSVDAPLLISRVLRAQADSFHELLHSHGPPAQHQSATQPIRYDGPVRIYTAERPVGKKIDQIRRENNGTITKVRDNESYDKWAQALASADGLIRAAERSNLENNTENFFTFVMPILVVSDGALWLVDYDDTGNRIGDPVQGDESTLWVDRSYAHGAGGHIYQLSHLHIYTRAGLLTFMRHRIRDPDFIERVFGFAIRLAAGEA